MRNTEFSIKHRNMIITPAGCHIKEVYATEVLDDGSIRLRPIGTEDTNEIIESYRESTELSTILARFANGDTSALNKFEGMYADFVNAPKDYREALQAVLNSEHAFNALPLSVREKFGMDYKKWLVQAGSDPWLSAMSDVLGVKPLGEAVKPVEPSEKSPE